MFSVDAVSDPIEENRNVTYTNLTEILDGLPAHDKYEHELCLLEIIEKVEDVEEKLRDIIQKSDFPSSIDGEQVKKSAFFAIALKLIRSSDKSELRDHLSDHEQDYGEEPLFLYLKSRQLQRSGRPTDLREAVQISESCIEPLDGHAGVHHNYARSVALAEEDDISLSDDSDKFINKAYSEIKRAIDIYPSCAEFYCTKGRLLFLKSGDHTEARRLIKKAMDQENSTRSDYALMMSEYQYYLSRVDSRAYDNELDDRVEQAIDDIETTEERTKQRIESYQTRMLQFLGFFAALLGVVVGSTEILTSVSVYNSPVLILFLTGSLLIAFAGFGTILPHDEIPIWRALGTAVSGFMLIVGGILILLYV